MAETPDPATPAPSETPKPETPSNNVIPPAPAPAGNVVDPAEVERLRKETEQKDLRIRQLENQEAARVKAETELKTKELEDNQQFKTLAEQQTARADAAEAKIAANERTAELKSESDKLFADYSPEVRKLAETTGLSLTDTDETSVTAFKAKLDEIKGMVGGPKVNPNNPSSPTPQGPTIENEDGMITTPLVNQPERVDELFKGMPGIASMMGPQVEE